MPAQSATKRKPPFSHGMPWRHPPLPPLHCENLRVQLKTSMHCDASAGTPPAPPHTADHSPQPCTNAPTCAFVHSRRAMAPSARREKQGGSFAKASVFSRKAGNFFETNGDSASLSSLMPHLSSHKINKTASSHSNITVGMLIRGGYKKLVSFLFGQQGRDVYFCGVLQQYYTETLHTMMI